MNSNRTKHVNNNSNQDMNQSNNLNNYRFQISNQNNQNDITFGHRNDANKGNNNEMSSTQIQQKYIQLNNSNSNATNNNSMLSNSNTDSFNGKNKSNRFPIELFAKNEISNQQTKLLNSYRIRSAQNLAKQRSTGK